MIVRSSSTGKTKVKRPQLIRMMEASTGPKSVQKEIQTDKRDYERPQPIKIAQLLGLSEHLKSIQKDSTRKRMQPERLGTYSNTNSTRKTGKKNGTGIYNQSINVQKCVRRNLDFNECATNSLKSSHESKIQSNTFTSNKVTDKKCSDSIRKKSLLLPPNTIKDTYLQKNTDITKRYSKISEIPNNSMHTGKKNTNQKEHKKVEIANSFNNNSVALFGGMEASNGHDFTESSKNVNAKCIGTNHVQCFETSPILKSDISFQCTSNKKMVDNENLLLIQYNPSVDRSTLSESNIKKGCSTKLKKEGECIQNICSSLQSTKLVDSADSLSEMVYINKNSLMNLERDLKCLLNVTEENLFKLKSVLTYVENLNGKIVHVAGTEEKHTEPEKINNIMVDKEVQVDTCSNLIQYSVENLKTPILQTPQIHVTNILSLNTNQSIRNVENDKENYEFINRGRTSDGDGSFLELENQLNIKHTKSTEDPIFLPITPVITRCKQKQKRSLREYMALKSTMKFLETPDGKKFKSLCPVDSQDNSVLDATYISNKILTELHNLYSESPEN